MDITIRALTPELTDDYLEFFDYRAFTDGSPFYPCYCNAYNMSKQALEEDIIAKARAMGGSSESLRQLLRASAGDMVQQGIIHGYLAYDGDVSVGWCNSGDRLSYYRVGAFDVDDVPDDDTASVSCVERGQIRSVVCFEIAPTHRGMGIAAMLLERVCADAAADGYMYVEGYPKADTKGLPAFTGPLRLYEKHGFTEHSRMGSTIVVRKILR